MSDGGNRKDPKKFRWAAAFRKVDKVLKEGTEVFGTLSKAAASPGFNSFMNAGLTLARKGLNLSALRSYDLSKWSYYRFGDDHKDFFLRLIKDSPAVVNDAGNGETLSFYNFYGKTIAHRSTEEQYVYFIPEETNADEINDVLAKATWDLCGSPCRVHMSGKSYKQTFDYHPAPDRPSHTSELCFEIKARIEPFIKGGESRSVMLVGPPGTGKSTIAHYLATDFGDKVLEIDVSDLYSSTISILSDRITRMGPDVLVLNDLDRFYNSDNLLSSVEELNRSLNLIIVTVNDLESLPKALVRPGRFDEIFEVKELDKNVILQLVGIPEEEIPPELLSDLVKWPAAFVEELGKRIAFLGKDVLMTEFDNLSARVKANNDNSKDKKDSPKELK
jgi:hypothetical protein